MNQDYTSLKKLAVNLETINDELNLNIGKLADQGSTFIKTIKLLNKAYMANLEALGRLSDLGGAE